MPTPFMHLHMVEKILAHPQSLAIRPLLFNHLPAFSFGNIAPDFQAICDVKREVSHFYPIPPQKGDYNAFKRLQDAHPHLSSPQSLTADEAVFTAAYGAHLLFDLIWDHIILTPVFRNGDWAEPATRFLAHNMMLTYIDREARDKLPHDAAYRLNQAPTSNLLPFATTKNLTTWQQTIANQLQPDAPSRTVEVYAKRMKMTTEAFLNNLNDPGWMDEHIFQQISWSLVQNTLDEAVPQAITLLINYLEPLQA